MRPSRAVHIGKSLSTLETTEPRGHCAAFLRNSYSNSHARTTIDREY
jgi:hypothetical protein